MGREWLFHLLIIIMMVFLTSLLPTMEILNYIKIIKTKPSQMSRKMHFLMGLKTNGMVGLPGGIMIMMGI